MGVILTTILSLLISSTMVHAAGEKKIRIGLSMDTLKEERWQRDRDLFVKRAEELGAEVLVQASNGNDSLQVSQAENLLTQNVDVLVVVPHNGVAAASIVEAAHKVGKKVIAYDRLIQNSDLDLYVTFDPVEVGRLQGMYALQKAKKGNFLLIGGAPTDFNALLVRKGQMEALKPALDRGEIKIALDTWARDWQPSEALKHTENALSKFSNNIQAIVASNDGTAGGAISALKQQKLAEKVLVTGQDADLAACQRIVEGTQSMTVYKPIKTLAYRAAEVAISLAKGEPLPKTGQSLNNGKKDVPSILIKPLPVDKANIDKTIIADGFHKKEAVYKNVK
ncbi:MAG: substrate-binding domain-containing protein [Oligoflexia bacterium]|nr:substrate-binding domain-containing protein [Oligoflexia bacterium]